MSAPVSYPRPLQRGDKVAIVSPASVINPDYVDGAVAWLHRRGYIPVVGRHALGASGSYSGTPDERLSDIRDALADSEVRAVLCSRGGYGAVHLIPDFPVKKWEADPRWLIGFSDISALHALLNSRGIVTVHASMCKALALREADDECNRLLFEMLEGGRPEHHFMPHLANHHGIATGRLIGGNLAVIADLIGTPVSPFTTPEDTILFIEDIAEPIYKVERILWQLCLAGFLDRVGGIVVGKFTEYRPDRNYSDMHSMIADMLAQCPCPVAFDAPIGHVDHNMPLLSGAPVSLDVNRSTVALRFQ